MVRAEDVKGFKASKKQRSILPFLKAEEEKEKLTKEGQNKKTAPHTKAETPEERLAKEDPDLLKYLAPPSDDEELLKTLLEDYYE